MKIRYLVTAGCALSVCTWLLPATRIKDGTLAAVCGVSTSDWLTPLQEIRVLSRIGVDDTLVLRLVAYCVIDVLLLIGVMRVRHAWMCWICAAWAFFWMIYALATTTPPFVQTSDAFGVVWWVSTVLMLSGGLVRPSMQSRETACEAAASKAPAQSV